MNRKIILSVGTFVLSLAAFAYDAGGTFSNDTQYYKAGSNNTDSFKQTNVLTAYFKMPFNEEETMYIAAEGNVSSIYSIYDLSALDQGDYTCPMDISLLKFSNLIKLNNTSNLQISAGRYSISDATSLIVNQPADGISAAINSQRISFNIYTGFTGLLNGINNEFVDSEIDDTDSDFYYLASPFILTSASFYAPYLFLNQSIGAELYAATGIKGPNGDNKDINRYYGTISINGPLVQNLFYTLSSTIEFQTNKSSTDLDFGEFANLTKFSISYYRQDIHNLALTASCIYASAKQGPFQTFTGLTSIDISNANSGPVYNQGAFKTGFTMSLMPREKLFVMASADMVLLAKDEGEKEKLAYNGCQFLINGKYQLFTDLQIGLTMYDYMGDESRDNKFSATLNAVISF